MREEGGNGIVLDGRESAGIGNVSSKNGGRGILASDSSLNSNISTHNQDVGIDTLCPSSIVANTIVANGGGIRVSGDSCVLANNATRR